MHSWIDRWRKRQRELAKGVDADLIQANRRRSRLAFGVFVVGFFLLLIDAKLHLPTVLRTVLRTGAVVCLLVGVLVGKWVQAEHLFLTRPDSEGPPEIFKNKP
jgi:hypothetical protein